MDQWINKHLKFWLSKARLSHSNTNCTHGGKKGLRCFTSGLWQEIRYAWQAPKKNIVSTHNGLLSLIDSYFVLSWTTFTINVAIEGIVHTVTDNDHCSHKRSAWHWVSETSCELACDILRNNIIAWDIHFPGDLKMKAVRSYETLVSAYKSTRH